MPKDPELLAHQQWLGYLQPVGLVVSPPALVSAQAFVNTNIAVEHATFLAQLQTEPVAAIGNLKALLTDPGLFGWKESDLVPADDPRAKDLEVVLSDYHETLKPTFAVPDGQGWLMLLRE